jgi:8-oxo-dGTP diphosphatase
MITKNFIAAKGVLVHEGRVLFLREAGSYVDGANIGKYDVAGGRLNPGEDIMDGLAREVREETGQSVAGARAFHTLEWSVVRPAEQWHIAATFFAIPAVNDKVQLSQDHDHYVWIDLAQPITIPLMKNYATMLEDLRTKCSDLFQRSAA